MTPEYTYSRQCVETGRIYTTMVRYPTISVKMVVFWSDLTRKGRDFSFKSAATIENGILCQKREKFKAI